MRAVVKFDGRYLMVERAVGGEYFNRLYWFIKEADAIETAKRLPPIETPIVVFLAYRNWIVTDDGTENGIKNARFRCMTLGRAIITAKEGSK